MWKNQKFGVFCSTQIIHFLLSPNTIKDSAKNQVSNDQKIEFLVIKFYGMVLTNGTILNNSFGYVERLIFMRNLTDMFPEGKIGDFFALTDLRSENF